MGYKRQGPKYQYWKSLIFRQIPVLASLIFYLNTGITNPDICSHPISRFHSLGVFRNTKLRTLELRSYVPGTDRGAP